MTIAMTPIEAMKMTYARCITLGVYEFDTDSQLV
jgi:hypothetical protein